MLSRVAESIYWMSRYLERAENVARFVDVNLQLMLDAPLGQDQQWAPLVATTGDHAGFTKHYGEATQQSVIRFLAFDPEKTIAVARCSGREASVPPFSDLPHRCDCAEERLRLAACLFPLPLGN